MSIRASALAYLQQLPEDLELEAFSVDTNFVTFSVKLAGQVSVSEAYRVLLSRLSFVPKLSHHYTKYTEAGSPAYIQLYLSYKIPEDAV